MAIIPENFDDRLESIFLENPSTSIGELELIIQEVYELIQREHPQIDLSSVIEKSIFVRSKNIIK